MFLRARAAGLLGATLACSVSAVTPPTQPEAVADRATLRVAPGSFQTLPEQAIAPGPRERPPSAPVHDRAGALAAVRAGNPEAAAEFLAGHVRTHSEDFEARLAWARALVHIGQFAAAHTALRAEIDAQPPIAILRARARLARRLGQVAPAEAALRQALARQPTHIGLAGDLLDLLVESGRRRSRVAIELGDGISDAFDVGRARPADDLLAVARATLARGSGGGFHDANMVLTDAEALEQPSDGSALADEIVLLHARIFLEKYAGNDASATLALILERDPWHPDALAAMANVALRSMQLRAASRHAKEALQVNPFHADAHAVLAHIALVEGRGNSASERVDQHVLTVHAHHTEGLAVVAAAAIARDDKAGYTSARDRALEAHADNGRFFTATGELLNMLHLYPEGGALLNDAVHRMPEDPYVQSAYAISQLQLGNETRAREALARAWKHDRFNERTFNVRALYIERIERAYIDIDRPGLKLRLPRDGHELVAPSFFSAIEAAKTGLDARYGENPGTLRIEVFSTPEDFGIRTTGTPTLGALGVCFGRVITLVGPYDGRHNFDQVVWHELSHTYAIALSRGRVPRWFTEGLSEWESYLADASWARDNAGLIRRAKARGKLRPFAEIELAFLRAENPLMMEIAYTHAAYAMRYIGETYGIEKIKVVLRGYGHGGTTPQLFKRHFGDSLAAIGQAFDGWLDRTLGDVGWVPPHAATERASRANAGDPRMALYRRALSLARDRAFVPAAQQAERLVAQGGDGFAARMLLARTLARANKPELARRHAERARAFDPIAAEPLVLLAELHAGTGDAETEKRALESLLAIDAMTFDPAARQVLLTAATEDDARFEYALKRAIAIAPLHPLALAGAALRAAKAGERQRSIVLLNAAQARLTPGPAGTLAVIALAHSMVGQAAQARAAADRALRDPKLPATARERLRPIASPTGKKKVHRK